MVAWWPTWRYSGPLQAPPWPCSGAICVEGDTDSVGGAYDVGGKIGSASLVHQDCPVSIRDGQVVKIAVVLILHIEGGELDGDGESLSRL